MNKILSCLLATSIVFSSCSEKEKDAKSYFDEVISRTDSVVVVFNSFIDGSTYFHVDSLNKSITKIDATIKEQGALIANMEDYKGDAAIRIAAITFINQLSEVSNSEFKKMVNICSISDAISEQEKSSKIDSLASVMGLKVNMASKPFIKAQTEFAAKNSIKLNFDYEIAPAMKNELDTTVLVK
jgi:hypothetical protein